MKSFTIEHVLIIFNPSSLIYNKKTCIFIGFTVPAVYLWAETSSGHFPKLWGGGGGRGRGGNNWDLW